MNLFQGTKSNKTTPIKNLQQKIMTNYCGLSREIIYKYLSTYRHLRSNLLEKLLYKVWCVTKDKVLKSTYGTNAQRVVFVGVALILVRRMAACLHTNIIAYLCFKVANDPANVDV